MDSLYPARLRLEGPGEKQYQWARLLYDQEQLRVACSTVTTYVRNNRCGVSLLLGVNYGAARILHTVLDELPYSAFDYELISPDPAQLVEASVKGRHVILLDDIYHTGATLKALKARLFDLGAAQVYSIVLLSHQRRSSETDVDYGLLLAPGTGWLVGYGLDWYGRYRHLNTIYELVKDSE